MKLCRIYFKTSTYSKIQVNKPGILFYLCIISIGVLSCIPIFMRSIRDDNNILYRIRHYLWYLRTNYIDSNMYTLVSYNSKIVLLCV